MNILKALFGNYSKKELKRIQPICDKVLALEDKYAAMSESELKNQTAVLKERLANGETTDDILPDAFAVCREGAWRVLGMKHYPVQIIGGIVLHQGRIAEMKTGEGKTLVATLPAYLNGLTGEGVHIVTVNDYLARRDSEWMGKLYRYLGLTTGLIVHSLDNEGRKKAYEADITYGTNNELGFDYLRDNMVVYKEQKVQRGHAYAIVDEVDSILIDEARTPLIISGKGDKSTDLYAKADKFARTLKVQRFEELDSKEDMEDYYAENDIDYVVDEKQKTATLTQNGVKKAEEFFGIENLTDPENLTIQHHVNQAIKAHGIMKLDVDYVVKDGEVIIVDEFTGRFMYGRRFNEGLHQAIEAKEGVKIQNESKTLATITFQNYFRLYKKLSGMTGTAQTEAEEFQEIYKLDVVEIPTNKPVQRIDLPDSVFKTEKGKFKNVIDQVVEAHEKGQPVLVGTISIEKSEELSKMLKKRGIKHNVLNAKQHEKEAEIVAQAGKLGAVTIATNMAGRGTDIILGGNAEFMAKASMRKQGFTDELIEESTGHAETDNEEILNARKTFDELNSKYKEEIKEEAEKVREAGGLYIIGTERHESRRVDRQLRGRAGRQGDPGSSQFFVSLEDDLMRLFGSGRIAAMMDRMGLKEGEVIQAGMMTKAIERAQKKVEENNFGIRKRLLEYDDVMNSQREVIYTRRRHALYGERIEIDLNNIMYDFADNFVEENRGIEYDDFRMELIRQVAVELPMDEATYAEAKPEELSEAIVKALKETYARRAKAVADTVRPVMERVYEDRKDQLDSNIYFPITDGHLGYNVPVNLRKCRDTDGAEIFKVFSKVVMFTTIDDAWREHLREMDDLRQSVQNATYEQKDPLLIYKLESFQLFSKMLNKVNADVLSTLNKAYIPVRENTAENVQRERQERAKVDVNKLQASRMQAAAQAGQQDKSKPMPVHVEKKVGRNDPCPCGSGKKYKNCHGKGL